MCWTRRASKNARSTASTRATGCSTSTPTSASTAGLVSRCARSRRSSTRTTFRNSGRTTRRRTTSSSTTSGRRAAPPRLARSTRTTPWLWPTLDARVSTELTRVPSAVSSTLPDFPWDLLEPAKAVAAAHPGGIVDLSIGTPVDPVPSFIREALFAASDAPGYPLTAGTPALREAIASWLASACGASGTLGVLPTIGSKELVAWLPTLLGIGAGDVVVIPAICYPTYEVGVRLAGATAVRTDSLTALGPDPRVRMIWINSPSNPTGKVLPVEHLRKVVAWARERGAVVASDECYAELGWTAEPVSVLHPDVCDGSHDGLLAVYSLSKQSNL